MAKAETRIDEMLAKAIGKLDIDKMLICPLFRDEIDVSSQQMQKIIS